MSEWQIQSGPCEMCGDTNYALSTGGPGICPACDCGASTKSRLEPLRKKITELQAKADHLYAENEGLTEKAVEYEFIAKDLQVENLNLQATIQRIHRDREKEEEDICPEDVTFAGHIEALQAENTKLQERLADWEDTAKHVMSEECAPDEKHCTCVPVLRKEITKLRGALEWLKNDMSYKAPEQVWEQMSMMWLPYIEKALGERDE